MSTAKTILIHGGLSAGTLAVIGYFFSQLAGMWVASQSTGRGEIDTRELVSTLVWRLPFAMAAIGFVLVAIGESLHALWKSPPRKPDPVLTEAEMQRLLGEQETLQDIPIESIKP